MYIHNMYVFIYTYIYIYIYISVYMLYIYIYTHIYIERESVLVSPFSLSPRPSLCLDVCLDVWAPRERQSAALAWWRSMLVGW